MQLRVVALGAHPEKAEELNEDFDKLIKGMEIKGVTQDRGKFEHYIDGMAKAVNVFGDTLRPTDYYEMFKYGRAATNALSDDFMLKTAPTLAQELGGSSAGKALSSFTRNGRRQDVATRPSRLAQYGLIDPEQGDQNQNRQRQGREARRRRRRGVSASRGKPILINGSTRCLLPALAKKGVTDPAKIQEVIAAIASQQTSAQMMSIFATQQSRIEKINSCRGRQGRRRRPRISKKTIRKCPQVARFASRERARQHNRAAHARR
jgi:hypothetical protein